MNYLNIIITGMIVAVGSGMDALAADNSVEFDLKFSDATLLYTEDGAQKTIAVNELPGADGKRVYKAPELMAGGLHFKLYGSGTSVGEAALYYSDDALHISWVYKVDMGSYVMSQNINNINWKLSAPGEEDYFTSFTITGADSAPATAISYSSSSKNDGKFSKSGNDLVWAPYSSTSEHHTVAIPDMGRNMNKNNDTFAWTGIKGTYVVKGMPECTNFAEVEAMEPGKEFRYTGEAVVTWHDGANLWLRDGNGQGMYIDNAGDIPSDVVNGYVPEGSFTATFHIGVGQEELQDIMSFTGELPQFVKGEPVAPVTVTTAEKYPGDPIGYVLGQIPVSYDGDYISITGPFRTNTNGEDGGNPPLLDRVLIKLDGYFIYVDCDAVKGTASGDDPAPVMSRADESYDYNWAPGDPKPDDNSRIVGDLTVEGLVMREAQATQLWATSITGKTEIPTSITTVESGSGSYDARYYDLRGVRIISPRPGEMVIRVDRDGASKILVK